MDESVTFRPTAPRLIDQLPEILRLYQIVNIQNHSTHCFIQVAINFFTISIVFRQFSNDGIA